MGTTQEVLEKLKGLDEKKMMLEDVIRKLFDHTGRGIPAHLGITANACDENRKFHVELPEISYAEIRERIVSFFPEGTEFAETNHFEDEAAALKERYAGHELVGNFFQRARPILLPKHDARKNYGASMQDFVLPAAAKAYAQSFPNRKFTNYRDGELAGNIYIIPGTGHDELLELMAEESVVAWYSPNPFQGFSIFVQREAMKILNHYGFALAGGVDTGIAVANYIGEMARDYNTPAYTCSALSWQSVAYSLHFYAHDGEFYFENTDYLADANGSYSGGLVLFR